MVPPLPETPTPPLMLSDPPKDPRPAARFKSPPDIFLLSEESPAAIYTSPPGELKLTPVFKLIDPLDCELEEPVDISIAPD